MALCDWLLSLSVVFPRLVYVVIWIGTSFLCMAKQHSVVWIHCILFIHQWMDIWVVSTFACYKQCFSQHLCTSISAYECFLWDIFLGVESLGHMIIPRLGFWGTAKLLFKAAASFYLPTGSIWGFWFLYIFADTCICFIDSRHPTGSEVVLRCSFDFSFPWGLMIFAFSYVLIGHLCSFFGEMSIQVFCPPL